jgi:FlaA1/EpsC-like NDP-sugar epimerase
MFRLPNVLRRILVTGSVGQIGSELVPLLRKIHGNDQVVATGLAMKVEVSSDSGFHTKPSSKLLEGPFEFVDICDKSALLSVVNKHQVGTIYHLAAVKFPHVRTSLPTAALCSFRSKT